MPAEPPAPVEPAASAEPGGAAAASEPAAPEPDGPEPAGPDPAGLARRFAAMFYDALLMAAALYAAAIPAVWVHGGAVPPNDLWFQAWLVFVAWFYLALSWTRGGQTLGMRAWRCRLVTADGGPVGWGADGGPLRRRPRLLGAARPRLLVVPRGSRPPLLARPLVRHPDRRGASS